LQHSDGLFAYIEDQIDEQGLDFDCQRSGNVLTIEADDGTKIVVGFRPKLPGDMGREVSSPNLNINVIAPDGQEFVDFIEVDPADAEMADDRCHVRYGQHCVTGNLREYHVVVAPVNGVGVDLRYEALVEPFRPGGTAHVALGAAVSAAHRKEALRVLEDVVEKVKLQLPVWKRQFFADGTSEWTGAV